MPKLTQQDRVSFSMGRKISDGDYGSVDLHMSYSTDVEPDETPETAMDRCVATVRKLLVKQKKRARKQLRR